MATFYSPKGRRNSYKTAYVPVRAHKVQLKVSTFNWIVVLGNFVEIDVPFSVDGTADEVMVVVEPAHESFLHSSVTI